MFCALLKCGLASDLQFLSYKITKYRVLLLMRKGEPFVFLSLESIDSWQAYYCHFKFVVSKGDFHSMLRSLHVHCSPGIHQHACGSCE